MRTFKFYLPALFVMLFAASAPALAQQGARRNTTVTTRQETRAERKQEKVNEVQKPANVASQSATDSRMRTAGGSQSDRRSGSAASSGGYPASSSGSVHGGTSSGKAGSAGSGHGQGSVGGGSGKSGGSSASGIGGTGSKSGSSSSEIVARPPAGGNSGSGYSGGNYSGGSYSGDNRPPVSGSYPGSGYDNRPPAPPAGTYPGGYSYPGVRPPLPTVRTYDRAETVYRTNCSSIVLRTLFRTKEEAYRYVEALLRESDYTIGTYGNGYSWLQSDVTFIPTPFDWTNPMTHNQFRIKVSFFKSFGYVKATISGEWRESVLSSIFSTLRFQPSSSYSTYYAWNVLEDLAEAIPHTALSYR